MSINQRGWTPINEHDPIWEGDHYDKVKPICDALAREWSRIHHEEEHRGFMHAWDVEDMCDYDLEPEEAVAMETMENLRRKGVRNQIEAIEEELEKLGVRMMGPYEHWGEEARYMEYMERSRD